MPYKDPIKAREANRASYRRYRTATLQKHSDWRSRNPQYMSERQLIRRYGIDLVAWEAMRAQQGNLCAICDEPFEVGHSGKHPVVDHCHISGRVRHLIHSNCNTGIGMFKDNPELLRKAAAYLEANNG